MVDDLKDRFRDRSPDAEKEEEESTDTEQDSSDADNSYNTRNASYTDDSSDTDNSGDADDSGDTSKTPGPDPDEDATRNQETLAMYLSSEKKEKINQVYNRIDAKAKLEGGVGIEKHADFMEAAAQLIIESEDELADRLGVEE